MQSNIFFLFSRLNCLIFLFEVEISLINMTKTLSFKIKTANKSIQLNLKALNLNLVICCLFFSSTGFGGGLANFAASTALNDYYVKDRVLAEGISGSTMCAGLFVGTGVLQKLVDLFEWQVVYWSWIKNFKFFKKYIF